MTTNFTDIDNAILSVFLDSALTYPIKYVGTPMPDKDDNEPWLKVTPMYSKTQNLGLRSLDVNNGVLQVDIYVKSGEANSSFLSKQISDEIITLIPKNSTGSEWGGVKVRFSNVGVNTPQDDGTWLKTMVSANFQVFTSRL